MTHDLDDDLDLDELRRDPCRLAYVAALTRAALQTDDERAAYALARVAAKIQGEESV